MARREGTATRAQDEDRPVDDPNRRMIELARERLVHSGGRFSLAGDGAGKISGRDSYHPVPEVGLIRILLQAARQL